MGDNLSKDLMMLSKRLRGIPEAGTVWSKTKRTINEAADIIDECAAALEWYGEQARLARLIHSEGDAGRHALAADGGTKAQEILAAIRGEGDEQDQ